MTELAADSNLESIDFSISQLYVDSAAPGARLRVGVALDGCSGTRVVKKMIEHLQRTNFVVLQCLIFPAVSGASSQQSAVMPSPQTGGVLAQFYSTRIDAQYHTPSDPAGIVELDSIDDAVRIDFDASAAALARIRAEQLDVILWFSATAAAEQLRASAKYGVWQFHYGDSARYRSPTPYLWELLEDDPTCAVELHALTSTEPSLRILCKSVFAATAYPSVTLNERAPLWGSQHFVLQKLWELHEFGWQHLVTHSVTPQHAAADAIVHTRAPGNAEMLPWLARLAAKKVAIRLRREHRIEHWRVAIRHARTPLYEAPSLQDALHEFEWIDSPAGHFWADPFLLAHNGELWLLIEDFDYGLGRAHLSACTVDAGGKLGPVEPMLVRPYHLSYPHVFAHAGEIYMIPESADSGAIELYRARRFPHDWVLEHRLLEMRCVDTTVMLRGDTWWMFTSPMTVMGHAPITLLLSAPQLTGPWRQHADSPITRDVRYARGAGNIIDTGSRLLRPSQDCALGYGHSIVFNEITRLDPTAYAERPALTVLPGWLTDLTGVHTYNRCGEFEVIDGKFLMPASRAYG